MLQKIYGLTCDEIPEKQLNRSFKRSTDMENVRNMLQHVYNQPHTTTRPFVGNPILQWFRSTLQY